MNKSDYIQAISKASNHYGDKLVELMDRNGVYNLPSITEEQARDFYCEMIQEELSMEKIFKYPLEWKENQIVKIPVVGVLCIQIQNNTPCLWAVVNEEKEETDVEIVMVGTGHDVNLVENEMSYISTTQIGGFVWHWFVRGDPNG